ncbi:hypothetical protein IC575_023345 [Cucumis melo]
MMMMTMTMMMDVVISKYIIIPSLVFGCVILMSSIMKLVNKFWWTPMRIQRIMRSQGINGPSYKFIQGNMRDMYTKRMQAMATPMELSHNILPRVIPHVHSWLNDYGRSFLQWYGMEAQLIITDPEMIKEVLNDKRKNYPKAKLGSDLFRIFGNGLVTSEGQRWAKSRKIANFAFHGDSLKNMIPTMIECGEKMIEGWKNYEGKELDVFKELKVYTLDVISHTAFGSSYQQGSNIFHMLQQLTDLSIRNGYKIKLPIISKILKSKDDIEGERLEKRMNECFAEIIRGREEKSKKGEGYGNDFLGMLVKAKNEGEKSERITMDVIVAECKTFYFAGHETTNVLITWIIFLLAIHKEWQEQATNEVLRIFGHNNPTYEALSKLKIMTMIINETLRLYPPAMTVSRQVVEKEVKLGSLVLPTSLQLTIPTIAVHHDKEFWGEDVHEFKPERFSEGVSKTIERNSAGYLPFGLGPRNCVGMNFAINEAKVAMSIILQKYSFTLSPAYAHTPVQFLTTCPQQGLQVILHSISN